MKSAERNIASTPRVGIIALVATAVTIIACTTRNKPSAAATATPTGKLVHAALRVAEPAPAAPALPKAAAVAKPSAYKLMTFRSRDYGVSFDYPWQYAFVSARAIADRDPVLHSKADGSDGPFTLVRIEIPKGYYPDTNFDSGYLSLVLDQQVDAGGCAGALGAAPVKTDSINGIDFQWSETEVVGGGHSQRTRRYTAFRNATCYEFELGLTTSNDAGLAREVDPGKVMARLDAILKTVNIAPDKAKDVPEPVQKAEAQPQQ